MNESVCESILEAMGSMPIVKLKLPSEVGLQSEILVKLESANPSGSLKDRIYKEMILAAINNEDLRPGMEIIEASTGNAGIACSFVGSKMGYKVTVVMPEGMSDERKQLIIAFGGK